MDLRSMAGRLSEDVRILPGSEEAKVGMVGQQDNLQRL